ERFRMAAGDAAIEEEKRRFTQKLGFRLLREVNAVAVAGATSVSATVLLSSSHAALRYSQFLAQAQTLLRFLTHQHVRLTASLERNAPDFKESLGFLENGGLIQRLPGEGGVIHVAAEKRIILDFYKNNTIHFFLLPALLSRALLAGLQGAAIKDEVSWWLELYRWEFALPEREAVAAELGRLLEYYRAEGALLTGDGERVRPDHALARATLGLAGQFCEAYWMTTRVIAKLDGGGMSHKAALEAVRKRYNTGLLLGEVRRPEGSSTVTIGNALSRYAEVGLITLAPSAKGREPVVRRGPRFDDLDTLERRLAATLQQP